MLPYRSLRFGTVLESIGRVSTILLQQLIDGFNLVLLQQLTE